MKTINLTFVLAICFLLSACTSRIEKEGIPFDEIITPESTTENITGSFGIGIQEGTPYDDFAVGFGTSATPLAKWSGKSFLTYYIRPIRPMHRWFGKPSNYYSNSMSWMAVTWAIGKAAQLWTDTGKVTLLPSWGPNADIVIWFTEGCHGELSCFDGPNGVVAHAFLPNYPSTLAGDIHFDDSEGWTTDVRSTHQPPYDLVTMAAHEFGHALGLGHSGNKSALMHVNYKESHRYLHQDDVDGIRSLYN